MKVMLCAFVTALVIAVLAPLALNQFGWTSAELTSSASVRLD